MAHYGPKMEDLSYRMQFGQMNNYVWIMVPLGDPEVVHLLERAIMRRKYDSQDKIQTDWSKHIKTIFRFFLLDKTKLHTELFEEYFYELFISLC